MVHYSYVKLSSVLLVSLAHDRGQLLYSFWHGARCGSDSGGAAAGGADAGGTGGDQRHAARADLALGGGRGLADDRQLLRDHRSVRLRAAVEAGPARRLARPAAGQESAALAGAARRAAVGQARAGTKAWLRSLPRSIPTRCYRR